MFERYISAINWNLDIVDYLVNIAAVAVIGIAMTAFFMYYAKEEAGKRKFSRNLLPVLLGMMFFASIVSQSATMALAGVGALSIIRYRAVVHNVESLMFVFMAIGVGLAAGTGRLLAGVIAAIVIMAFLAIQKWVAERYVQNMRLIIKMPRESADSTLASFRTVAPSFRVREYIVENEHEEWMIDLPLRSEEEIVKLQEEIRKVDDRITFSLEDAS